MTDPVQSCSADSRDDLVRFGFSSFSDRKFELIVINIKTGEEMTLEGQLRADQTIEQIDKILPTCVYVTGAPAHSDRTAATLQLEAAIKDIDISAYKAAKWRIREALGVLHTFAEFHDLADTQTPVETQWECGDANCGAGFVTIKGHFPTRCPECGGLSFRKTPEDEA